MWTRLTNKFMHSTKWTQMKFHQLDKMDGQVHALDQLDKVDEQAHELTEVAYVDQQVHAQDQLDEVDFLNSFLHPIIP